jgi:hypothetical protein
LAQINPFLRSSSDVLAEQTLQYQASGATPDTSQAGQPHQRQPTGRAETAKTAETAEIAEIAKTAEIAEIAEQNRRTQMRSDNSHPSETTGLIKRLRRLAMRKHDNLAVADEAADEIERLDAELNRRLAWLRQAHLVCGLLDIPPGHITERLRLAIEKLYETPVAWKQPSDVLDRRAG